ncbi:MAG: glycoside hydrolase family 3 C-terminal domain-containing protein [Hyphomonadaceae bacterium]|nr:glycoside hydrolase family 3 C-terminal domain-containing protein [Hyphomonadaceae bacterium]MBC6412460.1 glycoside hydrolase family 3 C-terminal domain-containing protein [Hyphomonadaceae bacterium]
MFQGIQRRYIALLTTSLIAVTACSQTVFAGTGVVDTQHTEATSKIYPVLSEDDMNGVIHPEKWPTIPTPPLDPEVEARINDILSRMTLEQKVGQVIQGDTNTLTAEDVKNYRLGSILSGGNSAPGDKPYAETQAWLDAADAYFEASLDPDGVEVAIPTIWGIDAVHGHTNVIGGVVFPHNVGLGAANDPEMIKRIAAVTARELNVTGHDWTFAPTLAVPQNDRWGRGYEGFSEDPEIVKSYGGMIAEGLQGRLGSEDFMGPERVMSTAKHFVGDGGTRNGVDQGDARISEEELRDIHLPGYESAIAMGSQSVMASFSSWQGQPMHGHRQLMTDVLKGRMNFQGFIVGDWNGHALIPDCTATDCPQALNAGLDMYMAPDSWKGLYESTLKHVKSGRIPMTRLNDANRRILRAKINSGIFDKPRPSARPLAGDMSILGSKAHRDLAREAVRKSLVLLKNNDRTLPLSPDRNIHVVGAGADSISKFSGGWTLSWQGRDHPNSDFPNGESFLTALRREVAKAGGRVTFDAEGVDVPEDADVIIAVYGEDPYAEFQGDRRNIDFIPNDFNTEFLEQYQRAGRPVVSIFISGRPLWVNPEMNASDAFVAAWLPGSEPAGITDLLLESDKGYDFTGRLSFSWPKLATQARLNPHHPDYDPLFELGYGLSLADDVTIDTLSEVSGVTGDIGERGVFFEKGLSPQPWRLAFDGSTISLPFNEDGTGITGFDRDAQEDALKIVFDNPGVFSIASSYPLDYSREANGAMELSFESKWLGGPRTVEIGAGCIELDGCENFHNVDLTDEWSETRISLQCAGENGVDLTYMKNAFAVRGQDGLEMAVSNVRLKQESAGSVTCKG